jgi:hypothetical protein
MIIRMKFNSNQTNGALGLVWEPEREMCPWAISKYFGD